MFVHILLIFVLQNGVFSAHKRTHWLPSKQTSDFLKLINKVLSTEKNDKFFYVDLESRNIPLGEEYNEANHDEINGRQVIKSEEKDSDTYSKDGVRLHVIENPDVLHLYQNQIKHRLKNNYIDPYKPKSKVDYIQGVLADIRRNAVYRLDKNSGEFNNINEESQRKQYMNYDDTPSLRLNVAAPLVFITDHFEKSNDRNNDRRYQEKKSDLPKWGDIQYDDKNANSRNTNYENNKKNSKSLGYEKKDDFKFYDEYKPKKDYKTYDDYKPKKDFKTYDDYKPKKDYKTYDDYKPKKDYKTYDDYKPKKDYKIYDDVKTLNKNLKPYDDYKPKNDNYKPDDDYKPKKDSFKPYDDFKPKQDSYKPYDDYKPKKDSYKPYDDYKPKQDSYKPYDDYKPKKDPYKPYDDYKPKKDSYKPYDDYKPYSKKDFDLPRPKISYTSKKFEMDNYKVFAALRKENKPKIDESYYSRPGKKTEWKGGAALLGRTPIPYRGKRVPYEE